MIRIVSLVCFCVLVSLGATDVAAQPKPKIGVLGLEPKDDGSGIDEKTARVAKELTNALRARAAVPNGPYNLGPATDKELVDVTLLAGCDSSSKECMAKIGQDMVVDVLLYGKLEKRGKGYQVSLWLLDIQKKTVIRSTTEDVKELGPTDLDRKGKELYQRIAGVANKGTLVVTANVDSGQVFIDDQFKSNLVKGQAKIAGMDAQRYRLGVESRGFQRYDGPVTVKAGETTTETVTLEKIKDGGGGGNGDVNPPGGECPIGEIRNSDGICVRNISSGGDADVKPGGGWRKIAIASGVVALAGGGYWVFTWQKIGEAQDKVDLWKMDSTMGCTPNAEQDPECNAAGDKWRKQNNFVAIPITIAASGLAVFAIYKGFINPGKSTREASSKGRVKKAPIAITPIVTPDGGGATVRIDW
jgi:hypothetical protein